MTKINKLKPKRTIKINVTVPVRVHRAISEVMATRGLLSDQDVIRLALSQFLKSAGYDIK